MVKRDFKAPDMLIATITAVQLRCRGVLRHGGKRYTDARLRAGRRKPGLAEVTDLQHKPQNHTFEEPRVYLDEVAVGLECVHDTMWS